MRKWVEFNAVYVGYFDPARLPARSAFAQAAWRWAAKSSSNAWPTGREGA